MPIKLYSCFLAIDQTPLTEADTGICFERTQNSVPNVKTAFIIIIIPILSRHLLWMQRFSCVGRGRAGYSLHKTGNALIQRSRHLDNICEVEKVSVNKRLLSVNGILS